MSRLTYEDAVDRLRGEWRGANPTQRRGIEAHAQGLLREWDLAPLIAIHEAGHAVVAHALGHRVECLSRVGSAVCGGSEGHVRTADVSSPRDDALIAAGGAALAALAGLADPEYGCERDRQVVKALWYQWPETVAAARELLADGWEPVAKLVVCALKTRPRLDAEAFADVVAGKGRVT